MLKTYVPVLKTKQGEMWAVKHLDDESKSRITPLFDVHRYINHDPKKKTKTPEEHLGKIVDNLHKSWGEESAFLIDTYDLQLDYFMSDGSHPVCYLNEKFREKNMNPIFCVSTDRDQNHIQGIKSCLPEFLCLRIHHEELDDLDDLESEVDSLLGEIEIEKENVILFVDFRNLGSRTESEVYETVSSFSQTFDLRDWKEFVFASSSFPENMTDVERDSIAFFDRTELALWKKMAEGETALYRKPIFSDYGINHPDKQEVDPRVVTVAGKIRYTLSEAWLVVRGHSLKVGNKYLQYHDLSASLVEREEYYGREYSWGDNFIFGCSKKEESTGNPTKWVAVDTNHHIRLVSEQFASLHVV